ncbi:ribosome small subunit-dependent GTPase A, partial [Acidobacteriota bacterium]
MDLQQLGWNAHFSGHFESIKQDGLVPARIAVQQKGIYIVYSEFGELEAEVSGRFRYEAEAKREYPTIGDWVAIQPMPSGSKAVIHHLLPRTSFFSRKAKGIQTEEQIVAGNIDTVFIVTGLDRDFNLRRIERYLTLAWQSSASPVVVLNKTDLCPDLEQAIAEVDAIAFGAPILALSAIQGQGLEGLAPYLRPGLTVAMLGSSGVGKSTIINALLGEERLLVRNTSEHDGRGQHTTTWRELVLLPEGGMIIDNPGMREIQLWSDEESLKDAFGDVEKLRARCRFSDCTHTNEPGCAVREALETGGLDRKRFKSYQKIQRELKFLKT